jgi:serine/threonine protein kinase
MDPFTAPELLSQKKLSVSVDLYSIGAILFNLVTGQPPVASSGTTSMFFGKEWQRSDLRELGLEVPPPPPSPLPS